MTNAHLVNIVQNFIWKFYSKQEYERALQHTGELIIHLVNLYTELTILNADFKLRSKINDIVYTLKNIRNSSIHELENICKSVREVVAYAQLEDLTEI